MGRALRLVGKGGGGAMRSNLRGPTQSQCAAVGPNSSPRPQVCSGEGRGLSEEGTAWQLPFPPP